MARVLRLPLLAALLVLIGLGVYLGKDVLRVTLLKSVAPIPDPPQFSPHDLFTGEGNTPTVEDFNPNEVVPQQPPITNVKVIAADEVTDEVEPQELVLGVVIDGQARAYPLNVLTNPDREIFNDVVADRPVAATW